MKVFKKTSQILNDRLIKQQDLNDTDVKNIHKLHSIKNCFIDIMEKEDCQNKLKLMSRLVTQIEFQLQKAWKFEQDQTFHRFWELPKCSCPKLDNEDLSGTGHRYINPNCLYHGK